MKIDLTSLSDQQLEEMYSNYAGAIRQNTRHRAAAEQGIATIEAERERRRQLALAGRYKAESPDSGLLRAMNYRTGRMAQSTEIRWRILDAIMAGDLPNVGSPAHMVEWDAPLTHGRYRKLHRVLTVLRSGVSHDADKAKRFDILDEDIDYIERTWKAKVR